ncbi:unnamed protein product [Vitrella brassicaformis CCMP3155]|uniref:Acyl-coenzyme A oxidase n=2 Tax=Vitrella brassicaformis TaxID=1169539 RepID=A0A0G4FFL4_VITBC|nr:unnamed protein product [Vitrella brassicaformis CCMP3155]|eukprot:CEM11963.1 unnamed protein product [Vitrella brassicaformis CCMP3155]
MEPTTLVDRHSVVPDLQRERQRASFRTSDLTVAIYGTYDLEKINRIRKLFSHNPKFRLSDLWWMPRSERYLRACERAEEFVRLCRQYKMSDEELTIMQLAVGEDFFLLLHLTMFLPCLQSLADDEQCDWWVPLARDFRIIGTYAQTELAHGSNVAGLETTADYDEGTEEWVLNTPSLSATKWWPGGLAKSCTHCICMARLKIRGKDYGPHPFFLQVRDLNTHEAIKGVTLFDIGQKLGYNGMDNGAMQLENVRIPRRHLLARYSSVDKQGNHKKIGNDKMMYGTMTYTRKQLVMGAGLHLAKACIIATRYSAVRRQFPSMEMDMDSATQADPAEAAAARMGGSESQVLDYSTQQLTIFPLMATAFAMHFTGLWTHALYNKMMAKARMENDFSLLPECHAVTSALKAATTLISADGMEACRKALGGHGFLNAAGVPLHFASFLPQATYEGDFVVLSIQTGRSLLKAVEHKMKGKSPPPPESTMRYIFDFDPVAFMGQQGEGEGGSEAGAVDWRDPQWQKQALEKRASVLIYGTAQDFMAATQKGHNSMRALDDVKIEMCRLTKAHAHVVLHRCFQDKIQELQSHTPPIDTNVIDVLKTLSDLYTLYWIDQTFGEFVLARVLKADHAMPLLQTIKQLLKEVRPNAVAIADSWNIPDNLLNSALGRYDGRVYEALYESTKYEPLNQTDVSEGYYRHIQYILHPERKGGSPQSRL